jgi:hypothetical protein
MDKLWIKIALIAAFVVSLFYIFRNASRVLEDPPKLTVTVKAPSQPPIMARPALPPNATPDQYAAYLKQSQAAADVDKQAIATYVTQVDAYAKDVNAQIIAAKAQQGDPTGRLPAFEKAVKDTIGALLVTPLLAALLIYSGIKVAGDVAMARSASPQNRVDAP